MIDCPECQEEASPVDRVVNLRVSKDTYRQFVEEDGFLWLRLPDKSAAALYKMLMKMSLNAKTELGLTEDEALLVSNISHSLY
jgi:ribosomal protein L22